VRGLLTRLVAVAAIASGCGATSRKVEGCGPGEVMADPDGHGMRCVDAASECLAANDCESSDPCCTGACVDTDLDRFFSCAVDCRVPECSGGLSDPPECGPELRCEVYTECDARCVPRMPCEEGWVVADPDGAGFRCIPGDSACFRPEHCAASTDPCCENVCAEGDAARFSCQEVCDGQEASPGGDGAGDPDEAFECYSDEDCAPGYGAGWTCEGCPGLCAPPPSCGSDSDCVLGIDWRECCDCSAYPASVVDTDVCVTTPDEGMPAGCDAKACLMACPPCEGPVTCRHGICSR
jgi:hypothetical protein